MAPVIPPSDEALRRLFPGDSELAALMRAFDWSTSALGPSESWPQNLCTAISICLTSRFPILLWWGPDFIVLYNDAYIPFLGQAKHPRYLGRPGRECWAEIWDVIAPMLESVRATGNATWSDSFEFFFARKLPREEVHVRFTYGPILARDGRTVEGIFTPCTEVTEDVIGARRVETLRKLGVRTAQALTVDAACHEVIAVLAGNPTDVPFAAVYVVNQRTGQAVNHAAIFPSGEHHLPKSVPVTSAALSPWPFGSVLQAQSVKEVDLAAAGLQLSGGRWTDKIASALLLPLSTSVQNHFTGVLAVGVSPRRPLDAAYRTFFELAAQQVGAAIADARACEEERRRAEALAELDRAKTAFFSNISHELRTPLTLMLGPLEDLLARGGDASPHVLEQLKLVHRNSLRLLKLVNTLLDVSRIEAGGMEPTFEATDLAGYTAEIAALFRSAIESARVRFPIDCPPLPEPVYVDRQMWEKIVLNLISNALKFTFEGEISVSIHAVPGFAELSVSDTGIGIEEHELARIFERFHRIGGAQGRTHEGSGIGLALVQDLARLHGGSVRVTSTPGRGSCFTVSIPFGSAHLSGRRVLDLPQRVNIRSSAPAHTDEALRWLSPSSDIKSEIDTTSASGTSSLRPRILFADDNADMRSHVQRLLRGSYEVQTAVDGEAALAMALEDVPDLVLTDVMMPRLDGFGLLRALRDDPRTQSVPVVLISARAGEESQVEGLEAGANDYIAKPFSTRQLLTRIRNLVAIKHTRDALQRELATKNEDLIQLTDDLIAGRRALKRSEAYLAEGQRLTHTGSWAWNVSTGDLFWSLEHFRIFGLDPETTKPSYALVIEHAHSDHRELVRQTFDRAVLEQRDFSLEFRIVTPVGTVRLIRSYAHPVFNEAGKLVEYVGTIVDITDAKRAEDALRDSEALLAEGQRLSHTGSASWNVSSGGIIWSDETYRIYGFDAGVVEPSYQVFLSLVHPDDRDTVARALDHVVTDRVDYSMESASSAAMEKSGTFTVSAIRWSAKEDMSPRSSAPFLI